MFTSCASYADLTYRLLRWIAQWYEWRSWYILYWQGQNYRRRLIERYEYPSKRLRDYHSINLNVTSILVSYCLSTTHIHNPAPFFYFSTTYNQNLNISSSSVSTRFVHLISFQLTSLWLSKLGLAWLATTPTVFATQAN